MGLRFYASGAPPWWRFQELSLARPTSLPNRRGFYNVLLDNGMFTYYKRGERPLPEKLLARLARAAHRLARLYDPVELVLVLPDWLGDPGYTYRAAASSPARSLCRDYVCAAVAHADPGVINAYYLSARELASLDHVHVIAAPLKLNCSRPRRGRRIVMEHCQGAVLSQVARGAREHGVSRIHGLGAKLSPRHLSRLARLGLSSFDTTSWTRPPVSSLRRLVGNWSAKTREEREAFFAHALALLAPVVDLEGLGDALPRLRGLLAPDILERLRGAFAEQ